MFFWNSLAFSMIYWILAIWSLVPLPFLNPAYTSEISWFMFCWSLAWRILGMTLLVQLCGSLNSLWHCPSLKLEWKLTFSSLVDTAKLRHENQNYSEILYQSEWWSSKNLQINAREGIEKREPSYIVGRMQICADTIEKLEGFSWWPSGKESAFQCRGLGFNP